MAENEVSFTVHGVESEAEVQNIKDELEEVDGVMGAEIDRESGEAVIRYDVDLLAEERVKITVREMGYEIE